MDVVAAIPLGLAIGLALGALGGGGTVLAVPALVYLLGQSVHDATTESLLVVTAAALGGGLVQAKGEQVCWPQALAFAPAAVAGAVAGTALNSLVGATVLLAGFAVVMLAAAAFTWRKASSGREGAAEAGCPPLAPWRTAGAGVAVGVMTGFFGVGGGFLVVPLLALALRFPLRRAIGTSLVIVAFVSAIGLVAHLVGGGEIDAPMTIAMAAACTAGAVAGSLAGRRLPQRALGRGFAVLVAAVAAFVLLSTAISGAPPAG